jgi:hypothetical protein
MTAPVSGWKRRSNRTLQLRERLGVLRVSILCRDEGKSWMVRRADHDGEWEAPETFAIFEPG